MLIEYLNRIDLLHNPMFSINDLSSGRLLAMALEDKARFIPERNKWVVFDGKRWVMDTADVKIAELGKDLADALLRYAASRPNEKEQKAAMEWCKKWVQRRFRDIYIKEARSVSPLRLKMLDRDRFLFNCENCTIDLRTFMLHEHRPEDFITKISSVNYDPSARSPRWLSFIDEIMSGDREKAEFMQRSLGYGMSGDSRHECLFILYGETTRNGKGTLMESVLRVMGDYGITVRQETIAQKRQVNSHAPSEDLARLVGVRFANISEPSRGLEWDAALVKLITGNDTINARFLNENSFDFKPEFKMYINTNYLPVVRDMTLFTSGRIVIIPFTRHFDEAEQDKTLKTTFAEPETQSAILNWLLEGYDLLRQRELTQPESVREATLAYYQESNKIGQFVEECLIKAADAEEKTAVVYEAYRQWCERNGYFAENRRNLNAELRKIASIDKKRPRTGGEKTAILIGYRLRSDYHAD